MKRDYDTTLARIAGNIAVGLVRYPTWPDAEVAAHAVTLARLIVARVRATEPAGTCPACGDVEGYHAAECPRFDPRRTR